MDVQTWLIVGVVALALLLVVWLPAKKQWNADGAHDQARQDEEE